jgi:peroxiredoxin
MDHEQSRRPPRWVATTCMISLLFVAGCGAETEPTSSSDGSSSSSDGPSSPAVAAHYRWGAKAAEGAVEFNAVADSTGRLRATMVLYPDEAPEEYTVVWDGQRIMEYSDTSVVEYTVYEAPFERHDDEMTLLLETFLPRPDSESFSKTCPGARRIGTEAIFGRDAVGYSCEREPRQGDSFGFREIWIDDATGLMLKNNLFEAATVDSDPEVEDDTFSTQPPAGSSSEVVPARPKAGGQAPDFTMPLRDGGTISREDLVGEPFVLAFFPADLVYDASGEICPGCFDTLVTLQELTDDGTDPAVVAVRVFAIDEGDTEVPAGIALPLAFDRSNEVLNRYGRFDWFGLVFIGADGRITRSHRGSANPAELKDALAELR